LNLGEKNSSTFKYFQGCVGTLIMTNTDQRSYCKSGQNTTQFHSTSAAIVFRHHHARRTSMPQYKNLVTNQQINITSISSHASVLDSHSRTHMFTA